MRKAIWGSVLALGLLALGWIALVQSEWLPVRSAAERAAIAALAVDPGTASGRQNGAGWLLLLDYDVPYAEIDAIVAADVARFNAQTGHHQKAWESSAAGRYARLALPSPNEPALCAARSPDCLAQVRAAPEAARERLAQHAPLLARARHLHLADHLRSPFPSRFDRPLAPYGSSLSLQLTDVALRYLDDDRDGAFAALCADAASYRRLRVHTDRLVDNMIGTTYLASAASLYAAMLSEQPKDFEAPCQASFAPLALPEWDQCGPARSEYLESRDMIERSDMFADKDDLVSRLLPPNRTRAAARIALKLAPYCGAAQRERIQSRSAKPLPAAAADPAWVAWVDPSGWQLRFAYQEFEPYYLRVLDLDGRLRLLNLAMAMRVLAPDQRAAFFAKRGALLDSPAHGFAYDAQRQRLQMRNLARNPARGEGEWAELPLTVQN